jgi:hypothetical protein
VGFIVGFFIVIFIVGFIVGFFIVSFIVGFFIVDVLWASLLWASLLWALLWACCGLFFFISLLWAFFSLFSLLWAYSLRINIFLSYGNFIRVELPTQNIWIPIGNRFSDEYCIHEKLPDNDSVM